MELKLFYSECYVSCVFTLLCRVDTNKNVLCKGERKKKTYITSPPNTSSIRFICVWSGPWRPNGNLNSRPLAHPGSASVYLHVQST